VGGTDRAKKKMRRDGEQPLHILGWRRPCDARLAQHVTVAFRGTPANDLGCRRGAGLLHLDVDRPAEGKGGAEPERPRRLKTS
jgi:hypothetical protein